MPKLKRAKTKYPGVYYITGTSKTGKPEKIYYIVYRKDGKQIEEKAGRQYQNDMTPARASQLRARRIEGRDTSNREKRKLKKERAEDLNARWTFNRLWREYLNQKPNLKGVVNDKNRFMNYILPAFGDKTPCEIVPLDVDRLRINLGKRLEPGTVRNVLELLRRLSNFGQAKGFSQGIPFKIQMPKVNNVKTEFLTQKQIEDLFKAIEEDTHPQAGKIMLMALYTGMRRGEIFRLKWEDIDLEKGFIHLREPKGGVDQTIPLNEGVKSVLAGIYRGNNKYIFPGRGGGRLKNIQKAVNRIKARAGLPKDFRPLHGLRHTFASMLASSGKVDMYTVQKLLTHKSPIVTQRYAHLRDDALKQASEAAVKIIRGGTGETGEKVININNSVTK